MFLRLALAGAAVLTFDQFGFYAGLHLLTGAPLSVLLGGWAAKMGAVAIYSVLVAGYLRWLERPIGRQPKQARVADVFEMLTYRERYEDLLARTGRDALTGAFDRGRLETHGREAIAAAAQAGRPVSLLLIDIDHFKTFNDRLRPCRGRRDHPTHRAEIMATVRASDTVFRFGGDEFVVICEDVTSEAALALGERVRREIATRVESAGSRVTVSIGVATTAGGVVDYDSLFQSPIAASIRPRPRAAIARSATASLRPKRRSGWFIPGDRGGGLTGRVAMTGFTAAAPAGVFAATRARGDRGPSRPR